MKIVAFVVACVFVSSSAQVWGADVPTRKMVPGKDGALVPGLSVAGEAEDDVKPNLAILSLGAVDDRPTAAAAAIENGRLSNAIVAAVKKFGIEDPDIRAEDLELQPRFRERRDANTGEVVERTFIGYRAFTMYRVQIHDVDAAPRIARQIVEGGTNSYRSLTFLAKDHEARFDALRAKAIANALQRAAIYASSASLKLGDIVEFEPDNGSFSGHSEKKLPQGPGAEDEEEVALSVPNAPQLESLRAVVRVTWELAPQSASAGGTDKKDR